MNAGGEAQVSANPHPGTATGKGFNNPGASSLYNGKGEHLSAWMKAHGNMTLQQQQAALEHEPGFRELPPETQQRYRDRLSELNALPPAERQRRLAYTEQMERLTPQQRTEVRSTMLQLSALPPEQKKTVMHAFHELRGLPPEQRLNLLNTRYRNFSEPQRNTLEQLMRVEPMLPADHFAENQPPPGQPR
jgi:DNA-directed RNA polymerase subunit F